MTRFRRLTVEDLDTVLEWAAAEGWNPGWDDAEAFHRADPAGFFGAEVDGRLVAAISVVNHTPTFAFLGLYICQPDMRGKGIGLALWQHAVAHAGERCIGLDGVPDQQENYRASGFVLTGQTTRYTGPLAIGEAGGVREAQAADLEHLIAREGRASGVIKPGFMEPWFAGTARRRTWVDGPVGTPRSLATLRECRSGYKIGPLVAEDEASTRRLLCRNAEITGSAEVSVDVPASAAPLARMLEQMELAPGFVTARMYRGGAPTGAAPFYAVATLELG